MTNIKNKALKYMNKDKFMILIFGYKMIKTLIKISNITFIFECCIIILNHYMKMSHNNFIRYCLNLHIIGV